jgi:hypothetical protein
MSLHLKYSHTATVVIGLLAWACPAGAQFVPAFLQNASYWRDGKSEIDFYNADFARDGQHYPTELLMVFTPDFVDPNLVTVVPDPKQTGTLPIIRMHQTATVPRGLLLEHRSLDALWRMDFMSLARLSFVGSDGVGPVVRSITESRDGIGVSWKCSEDSYRNKSEKTVTSPDGIVILYDELPLRVRTIDFSKGSGSFEIQLGHTMASFKTEEMVFKPATVSYKISERAIEVEVKQEGPTDHFVVDRDFPFLLRDWKASDGSQFKLKNSIKADMASYTKPGDRERALKDPMLRHPD